MCHSCLVDGAFLLALALHRAGLLPAGAGLDWFGGKFVKKFSVVSRYNLSHVGCRSITDFNSVFVKDFVEGVGSRKT